MGFVDGRDLDEDLKPFKFSEISAEDVFIRIASILEKKFGDLSLKLYQNYYTDSISSMLNPTIVLAVLILNLIASKYSIFIYFGISILSVNFDEKFQRSIYKFFGKISVKIFRYTSPYSLLEEEEKPEILTKDDYQDF
mmetsp:Transcript_16317/g.18097  ORF Transcript_16317/g.18097 Transcript_16317/m.18097 type:complete len:138 (+) Transcript_16317:1237-1650(+)